MANRLSNIEMFRQGYMDAQNRKQRQELNRLAEERIQKDRDVAEMRQRTVREIAEIRSKSATDRRAFDQIVEDRRALELAWKITRENAKDASSRAEADRKYEQNDKELSQRQLEAKQRVEHWQNQEEEKRYEFDNPSPAKLPEDRIETTDPVTGQKTVIHVPKGEVDRRQAAADARAATQAAAQAKADASRPLWMRVLGRHATPPPLSSDTGTNLIPNPAGSLPVPPMSTGTNAPEQVIPPVTVPGIPPVGLLVPPMIHSNGVPSPINRIAPPPLAAAPGWDGEAGSPYAESVAAPVTSMAVPAAATPNPYVVGRRYKGGLIYKGGNPTDEASWEKAQ